MTGPDADGWVVPPTLGARPEAQETPLLVTLPPAFATEAADAAGEAAYLLIHAANIFGLLGDGIASGGLDAGGSGVQSLCEVCQRAFRDMANKEGETLAQVEVAIRRPIASRAQSRREAELIRQQQEREAHHAAQP